MDTINISFSRFFCLINGCTIILSSQLPAISEDVTIQGVGDWKPTISGAFAYRIFDLQAVVVNISNMYLIRGNAVGSSTAGYGGAINTSSSGTTLQVTNVGFFENHATSRGGAIQVSAGIIVINNSTFSNNTVDYYGGAIGQYYGVLILTNSTISGNSAVDGGGIEIQGSSETRLTNVTLSGNTAKGRGGGISRIGTSQLVSLNNVTITGNTADFANIGSGNGGGIYRGGGNIAVYNSIIAGNYDSPNNSGSGTIHPDCSGELVSSAYTLLGMNNGCTGPVNGVDGNKVGTIASPIPPVLNPLANNGGATQTHSLSPFSPAVDSGNPLTPGGGGFAACAAADQRGVSRPIGLRCDMGAFEGSSGTVIFLPVIRR
jgi:predicted outer membrane repeat protein